MAELSLKGLNARRSNLLRGLSSGGYVNKRQAQSRPGEFLAQKLELRSRFWKNTPKADNTMEGERAEGCFGDNTGCQTTLVVSPSSLSGVEHSLSSNLRRRFWKNTSKADNTMEGERTEGCFGDNTGCQTTLVVKPLHRCQVSSTFC